MMELALENLTVTFGSKNVLKGLDARFHAGQMIAVLGQNGSGKTTLLKAIAGFFTVKGRITLSENGQALSLKSVRYVPQMTEIATRLTVFEMVLLGLVKELSWRVKPEIFQQVDAMLHALEIDHLAYRPMNELSGGQKQLVFLAQAFVSRPKVLLLDEPTSALDLRYQLIVMNAVKKYTEQNGAITLTIMHDLLSAARFSDQILLLDNGTIGIVDAPELVLEAERLEKIYHVRVSVERTQSGLLNVIPINPL